MRAWHPKALARLAVRAVRGWIDDQATSMGAALAFYSLLSLAPRAERIVRGSDPVLVGKRPRS
jgi:uncharacterized BrkB/YihY/UPF0761 family membrane protein